MIGAAKVWKGVIPKIGLAMLDLGRGTRIEKFLAELAPSAAPNES